MTDETARDFDFLERAGLILMAFQIAIYASLWMTGGLLRSSDGYFLLVTALFVANQRKILRSPPNRGAASWVFASRVAVLAVIALGTLVVAAYRIVPDIVPAAAATVRGFSLLLWIVIALKGAGIGKLKPGSAMGIRVPWTTQSRLAWDRAHRTLGRILFWGGLVGLSTSLVVPPLASFAMWGITVALAVTAALVESWRTCRLDPDRSGRRPA